MKPLGFPLREEIYTQNKDHHQQTVMGLFSFAQQIFEN